MGSTCSCVVNRSRDEYVDLAANEESVRKFSFAKLLLLGTGSSGKSTLFKSLRVITKDQRMDKDTRESLHWIRDNCVTFIVAILWKSQALYDQDPVKNKECVVDLDEHIVTAQLISKYYTQIATGHQPFEPVRDHQEVDELGVNM